MAGHPVANPTPINEVFQRKIAELCVPKFEPRRYQKELFEETLKRNVIIYLGTGLGKTFITVLYLNDPTVDHLITNGRKAVFLAITQDLVKQQATYLNKQIRFKVKIFCSRTGHCGKHIDHWSEDDWREELKNVDVLFLTPQVFLNAISTNLLNWDMFSVIFYDECHHGSRPKKTKAGTPYYRLLTHYKNFYLANPSKLKPRIIGLTASLIDKMPTKRHNVLEEVKNLEHDFQSICITDLKVQSEMPKTIMQVYEQPENSTEDTLSYIFDKIIHKMNDKLKLRDVKKSEFNLQMNEEEKKALSFINRLKLASAGFSIKPTSFPDVMRGLKVVHERCGLWALRTMCDRLAKAVKLHTMGPVLKQDIKVMYDLFKNILLDISEALDEFLVLDPDYENRFVRPKTNSLLDVLKSEYEAATKTLESGDKTKTFSCIVFVRSRLEVVALNAYIQRRSHVDSCYSFIKCDYAIGLAATMASKYSCMTKRKPSEQSAMLDNFRLGHLNVIITTAVLEEGIDLPRCSTVIRYDEPYNFREYVQSRGRARQAVSNFILLSEISNIQHVQDKLNKFNDFEITLGQSFANNNRLIDDSVANRMTSGDNPRQNLQHDDLMKEDTFCSHDMHLQVSASVAKTILHMYCARLSKGTPFTGHIQYETRQVTDESYQTTLFLPSGCPYELGITGNVKATLKLANSSAIVAAVKKLYDIKEINEHAVPARASESNIEKKLLESEITLKKVELTEEQKGHLVTENDRTVYLFEPLYLKTRDNLMLNYRTNHYKFVKVHFRIDPEHSRAETMSFFQAPTHGLILHNSVDPQMLPKHLYGHYGNMEVEYTILNEKFLILRSQDHEIFMNYMYRLLTLGLFLPDIDKSIFKSKCLVYAVPLKPDSDEIDGGKLHNVLNVSDLELRDGDLVKLGSLYEQKQRPTYYLVKKARTQLSPRSFVPNRNYTFLEDMRYKYGPNIVAPAYMDQPIVEVVPISQAMASLKPGSAKSQRSNYQTSSLFFLEQQLNLVNYDPSSLIQLYSLSIILYKAYHTTVSNKLDISLNEATKHRVVIDEVVNPAMEVDCSSIVKANQPEKDDRKQRPKYNLVKESQDQTMIDTEDLGDEEHVSDEDDDCSDVDDEDSHQSSCDNTDGEGDPDQSDRSKPVVFSPSEERILYETMLSRANLDLNLDDNNDDLKPWDMRQYKEADIKQLPLETRFFRHDTNDKRSYEESVNYRSQFQELDVKLDTPLLKLCTLLENFEFLATSDTWLVDQDGEFKKRIAKVDTTLKPGLYFDNFNTPLDNVRKHNVGILEALTLKSAEENYDLEVVENLGDSFLKYMVSVVLYRRLQGHEGFLTSARSRLVSNKYFEYLAKLNNLGSFAIRAGFSKHALANLFGKRIRDKSDLKSYCTKLRPKDLADMFEAIVGYYLASQGQFRALMALEWLGLDIFKDDLFEKIDESNVRFAKFPSSFVDTGVPVEDNYSLHIKKMEHFIDIIGYRFRDMSHLVQAFTHPTVIVKHTRSYERMEFLGDAILDFLVSTTLLNSNIAKTPGQLTTSRSSLVNNYVFAKLAIQYKFDMFINYFSQEMYDQLSRVRQAIDDDPELKFLDMIDFDAVVKLLADIFESVAGAIYIDSGGSLDQVWSVYYPMMYNNIMKEIAHPTRNPTAKLFETFPGRDRITFDKREERVGNDINFKVECNIRDYRKFEGIGSTFKQAKLRCVQNVLNNLPDANTIAELNQKYQLDHPHRNNLRNIGGRPRGSISKRGFGRGRDGGSGRARLPQLSHSRGSRHNSQSRNR